MAPIDRDDFVDGPVPEHLPGGVACGPLHQVAPGAVLFTMPTVGRFLVTADAPVVVDRAPGTTDHDVAAFVGSTLLAARHLLAGRFSFRGCAVEVDGSVVVLAGAGGTGASVLAGTLVGRGHRLVADGVVAVDEQGRALPGDGSLRLQPSGSTLLGFDHGHGAIVRPGIEKRAFPVPSTDAPLPVARVVRLRIDRSTHDRVLRPVPPKRRLPALLATLWHHGFVPPLQLSGPLFGWVTTNLRNAELHNLRRPPGTDLDEIADLLVEAAP